MLIPSIRDADHAVRALGHGTLVSDGEPRDAGWRTLDLTDPHLYASGNPHAAWSVMRERAPLHRAEGRGGSYVSVTRHQDASEVLGDAAAFTSERGSLLAQLGRGDPAAGKMLVSTDPPEHTRLRRALSGTMTPSAVRARAPEIQAAARDLVEAGLGRAEWDLAVAATRFPLLFTGALMGVEPRHWDDLAHWTLQSTAPDDPAFVIGNPARTLATSHHELLAFFHDEVHRHVRLGITDDLIGALIAGTTRDARDEAVYNCYSLLLGANATTPHSLCLTVLALMQFPDQWRKLQDDPTLIESAVEEGLRWSSPANSFLRYAVRDVALPSGIVHDGEAVAVWIGSANRDAAVFDRPFTFDVKRHPNRHIAFGVGPHYCVGATLARAALLAALTELASRTDRLELVGPVEHLASVFVAGVRSMPVRLVA